MIKAYNSIDISQTLEFMSKRYVEPLSQLIDIRTSTLCDCAAGFGWLSFAYLLAGGKRAMLCEYELARLAAARAIARALEIDEQRCEFVNASLHQLPLRNDSIDVFASVETLEHVGRLRITSSIQEIARVSRRAIFLTTPNQLFPVDMHDTRLPLTHWLPSGAKPLYARLFGRERNHFSDFIFPWSLTPIHNKFRPVSRCYGFSSLEHWRHHYPHYNPYLLVQTTRPTFGLAATLTIAAKLLGRYSFVVAPNLQSAWLTRDTDPELSHADSNCNT